MAALSNQSLLGGDDEGKMFNFDGIESKIPSVGAAVSTLEM